jgi:AraC-like DNA-binding protein
VLNISSLLKELIVHASTFPRLRRSNSSQRHIIDLILDQLKVVESIPIQLPLPRDPRARKLVDQLFADPSDQRALNGLCYGSGASKRTIQRLFIEETGMSFSKWRQRWRLISAMQRLAAGEAVTTAALESGYNSASAFVAMFRKQLGMTPGRYLSAGLQLNHQSRHSEFLFEGAPVPVDILPIKAQHSKRLNRRDNGRTKVRCTAGHPGPDGAEDP